MKIRLQLLDEDDLKGLEDTLTRALVRAFRTLARDGMIPGVTFPPKEAAPDNREEVQVPHLDVREAPTVSTTVQPPATTPTPITTPPPTISRHEEIKEHKRSKRRSAKEVCKTVADRPIGFIDTNEAIKLIGGRNHAEKKSIIGQWVLNKEIPGVIVHNIKPPTKGLDGRLMIDKRAVIERESTRRRNAEIPLTQRGAAA